MADTPPTSDAAASDKPRAQLSRELVGPFLDASQELVVFVDLAWAGLHDALTAREMNDAMKRGYETLARSPVDYGIAPPPTETQESLKRLEAAERFSSSQKAAGFPYLYGLAVIRLWAILESFVADLVVRLLRDWPTSRSTEAVRRLKGPLIEFADADPSSRAEFLVDMLAQDVRASLKAGVGRFEVILEAVGLTGTVADPVRRSIYEFSQVRNAIAHRNGIADARFIAACPWFGIAIGTHIPIDHSSLVRYNAATTWYVFELTRRWGVSVDPLVLVDFPLDWLARFMNGREVASVNPAADAT